MADTLSNSLYGKLSDPSKFRMINNYIYAYHLNRYILLPLYPDSINETHGVSYNSQSMLSRSAPIFSYQNSGPRSTSFSFTIHRELMNDVNKYNSLLDLEVGDDYVDYMIKLLQACSLPTYNASQRKVDPPIIALRLGNDIFIKGVINGAVQITYNTPILPNGKYAVCTVSFSIYEVDPYDAMIVANNGSYRPAVTSLARPMSTILNTDTSITEVQEVK